MQESPERNELNYPASKNVESELFSYSYDFKQNPSVDFYYIPHDLSMPKLKTLTLNEERVSRLC